MAESGYHTHAPDPEPLNLPDVLVALREAMERLVTLQTRGPLEKRFLDNLELLKSPHKRQAIIDATEQHP